MKFVLFATIALFGLLLPAKAESHVEIMRSGGSGCCHTIEADLVQVVVAPRAEAIRRIQAELAVLGFNPGPIDGVIGPRTMTALRAFQRDEGLLEGLLTVETLTRLGIGVRQPVHLTGQAHSSAHLCRAEIQTCPGEHRVIRRVVERRVVPAEPAQPIRSAAPGFPNYIHPSGAVNVVTPLEWSGKTER